MGRASGYSMAAYGKMFGEGPRRRAYEEALRRQIRPGHIVVELGAGPGLFSMLACRLGAARAYAIEPDDAIQVGVDLARANGLDDRIVFLQSRSEDVTLPERADVLLFDLRGRLPTFGSALTTVADARERFLKPGGTLIAARDDLGVALAQTDGFLEGYTSPWHASPEGLDLRLGLPYVLSSPFTHRCRPGEILSESATWATIDYASVRDARVEGEVTVRASRDGVADALQLWFTAHLGAEVSYTTGPGSDDAAHWACLLPLSDPLTLRAGESVRIHLVAHPVSGDYVWTWSLRTEGGAHRTQSDFAGSPLTTASLRRNGPDHVPEPTRRARWALRALQLVDGRRSQGDIARVLAAEFPEETPGPEGALARLADLLSELSS